MKDLRTFIQYVEEKAPNHIVRVHKTVKAQYEIPAIISKLDRQNMFPTLVFENVEGYEMPVLTNLYASRKGLAMALETTEKELFKVYSTKMKNCLSPKLLEDGPIKEVIKEGEDVNLFELPIITYHEKDQGPFITAGAAVIKDNRTGLRNIGIYRMQLKGKDKLGIWPSRTSHIYDYYKRAQEENEPLEIAIIIGMHPAFYLGVMARNPLGIDEYEIIGGVLGEPLQVVQGETVDLEVPARAEMVIEGEIPPNLLEDEGPFGEVFGYYGPKMRNPIVNVKAITRREDAFYHDISAPNIDHYMVGALPREAAVYDAVSRLTPSIPVKAVHVPPSGHGRLICYISLKKLQEVDPKIAILAAFVADAYLKYVVIVGDDVDIFNESEVLWALVTRTRPNKDVILIPVASGSADPSSEDELPMRVGIDATRSLEAFGEKVTIPGVKEIVLEDYIKEEWLRSARSICW
ncbi:MAG: UbiD family decarboxylase [Candidatus Bathyarchaeota archaeon]|nr:UbiD family decarboxylase [Candidatus Bathyarchaeota archaeon]MDH5733795.1 UbiD family decarboxylase [Candidatus Bathyarchaeota archaeon]